MKSQVGRTRFAREGTEQMAEIYALRFKLLIGIWEDVDPLAEKALPILDLEALEAWVRQSMSVDLDALIDQPKSTRNCKKSISDDTDSVVAVVKPEVILQMVEQIEADEQS